MDQATKKIILNAIPVRSLAEKNERVHATLDGERPLCGCNGRIGQLYVLDLETFARGFIEGTVQKCVNCSRSIRSRRERGEL